MKHVHDLHVIHKATVQRQLCLHFFFALIVTTLEYTIALSCAIILYCVSDYRPWYFGLNSKVSTSEVCALTAESPLHVRLQNMYQSLLHMYS